MEGMETPERDVTSERDRDEDECGDSVNLGGTRRVRTRTTMSRVNKILEVKRRSCLRRRVSDTVTSSREAR